MILIIESTTKMCSVALVNPATGQIHHIEEEGEGFIHSEKLSVFVDELLRSCSETVQAIAISQGPGSYTGLRIGTSLAKGLCFSLQVPLVSYCGLKAMAQQHKGWVFAAIDARRNEVFGLLMHNSKVVHDTWAENFDSPSDIWKDISEDITLVGDCQAKVEMALHNLGKNTIRSVTQPSATWAKELVLHAFKNGEIEDTAYFVPKYLKDFQVTPSKK